MKFKLISKIPQISNVEAYRKVGFSVSDTGELSSTEIDIDTDGPGFFNSYSKLQNIRRLREILEASIIINGDNWNIQN
jgi:hypothetical protein